MEHGEVSWPSEELPLERTAAHMQELSALLKTGPAFLVGVSMGADIAMRMTLSQPQMDRGLILVSPWSHTTEYTWSLVDRLFRLAEAGDMVTHTAFFIRYVVPTTYLNHHSPAIERLRTFAMEQHIKTVAYTWAACMASNLSASLVNIHVPNLVITGLNDLFTPQYVARAVTEELPEVELEIWEETRYFPFLKDSIVSPHGVGQGYNGARPMSPFRKAPCPS